MSMKSFDKFCEKIILSEPGSEREIFDERQKQMRTQLLVQALTIYAVASAACVMLNEDIGFLESSLSGMVFIASAAYLWWVILAAVKGCLFGVSGKQVIYNAIFDIALIPVIIVMIMPEDDEPPFTFVRNGVLTTHGMLIAAYALFIVSSIVIVALNIRKKHAEK